MGLDWAKFKAVERHCGVILTKLKKLQEKTVGKITLKLHLIPAASWDSSLTPEQPHLEQPQLLTNPRSSPKEG